MAPPSPAERARRTSRSGGDLRAPFSSRSWRQHFGFAQAAARRCGTRPGRCIAASFRIQACRDARTLCCGLARDTASPARKSLGWIPARLAGTPGCRSLALEDDDAGVDGQFLLPRRQSSSRQDQDGLTVAEAFQPAESAERPRSPQ